jgi:type I restriction enzyme S subunit
MGQSPPSSTYNESGSGLPFFQGKVDFGFRHPTPRVYCSVPQKIAEPGDILISVRAPVGPVNICDRRSCIGRGLGAIRPTAVDPQYLYFELMYLEPRIAALGTGSTFQSINRTQLGNVEVNTCGFLIDEQRQIAAVLTAVQRAIEQQQQLIALTAEFKKALMQKLFTEGTRGEQQRQTEIGTIPESWEVKRVDDVCDLVSGGTPSKAKAAFWNGQIPWASPKDMKQSRLSDAEDHVSQAGLEEGSRLVPAGSIFVVIRGMILMRDVPIAQALVPMAFNQDMKALVGHRTVSSDFLLYSLQNARDRLFLKVGTSAHGTRTLMTSAIGQLPIGVPSESEQEAISQVLKLTEVKESIHNETAVCLRDFFRALLHQLMTAQVRVRDLDLSPLELQEAAQPIGMA